MAKILVLNPKTQNDVIKYLPTDQTLQKLASFFDIFSDITRIKILTALCITSMCVNDLSVMLKLNQTTVSHQLRFLKQCGAVEYRRNGKIMYYSLSCPAINDIMLSGVDYLLG